MDEATYCLQHCIKFDFGLPLEDVFPPDDLHPQLKNLFCEAFLCLAKSPFANDLSGVLRQGHASVCEKLSAKDSFTSGRTPRDELSPETYLWLIRHFLGLLPLPVLPSYANGRHFAWEALAILYRRRRRRLSLELETELVRNIERLPSANLALLDYFFTFLREIALDADYNRKNLTTLTKYFTASLLHRPYRPGFVHKFEKLYYPFTYFLIEKWAHLRTRRLRDFKLNLYDYFCANRSATFGSLAQEGAVSSIGGSGKLESGGNGELNVSPVLSATSFGENGAVDGICDVFERVEEQIEENNNFIDSLEKRGSETNSALELVGKIGKKSEIEVGHEVGNELAGAFGNANSEIKLKGDKKSEISLTNEVGNELMGAFGNANSEIKLKGDKKSEISLTNEVGNSLTGSSEPAEAKIGKKSEMNLNHEVGSSLTDASKSELVIKESEEVAEATRSEQVVGIKTQAQKSKMAKKSRKPRK